MKRLLTFITVIITLMIVATPVTAKHDNPEKYYQEEWCKDKGVTEYLLPDKTRVDCLTETHAIEFDFAKKWAEAVGQALHYASMTGKKAGIVLILEDVGDPIYYYRIQDLLKYYGLEDKVTLWYVGEQGKSIYYNENNFFSK